MNKNLALFDFDGTITKKDTLIEFIRFYVGEYKFIKGLFLLSPILIAFKLKLIPNYKAKEIMIKYFFKGENKKKFLYKTKEFSLKKIDLLLRKSAIQKLKWHKERGDTIVIVSASIECWLEPWCNKNNFNLIGTKLEFDNDIITGSFLTKNCYGIEKVKRIKQLYSIDKFNYIYAYGDSKGDIDMLKLAHYSYYKYFKN